MRLYHPALVLVVTGAGAKFSRKTAGQREAEAALEALCRHRNQGEFFRVAAGADCREVATCDREPGTGNIRLAPLKCPSGLYFDIEQQTCDWLANVENCALLSLPRRVKPNLATDTPVCPGADELQCGSGECLPRTRFCDRRPDCADGSDENVCSVREDPNRAAACDLASCRLPDCYCSPDGTRWPGDGLQLEELPMMVTLSFNGAVTEELIERIYSRLFHEKRENPNGCSARGTFFVSHKYTDYAAVEKLHRNGHEIGVFSVTHREEPAYWTQGDYDTWEKEMVGARLITERFANITDGSILGVRAPFLRAGGNDQFRMMADQAFTYDASLTAPLGRVPVWPYTLHHRLPHRCIGTARCPSRPFPVWELPINELDRREGGEGSDIKELTGCHHVSSCTHIYRPEQLFSLLEQNFRRHYRTNRAPLSLSFSPAWLLSQEGFIETLGRWMTDVARRHQDVYFVTGRQVVQWMERPTAGRSLRDFEPWKAECAWSRQAVCQYPTSCALTSPELPGEELRLVTCAACPASYPWLLNPSGGRPGHPAPSSGPATATPTPSPATAPTTLPAPPSSPSPKRGVVRRRRPPAAGPTPSPSATEAPTASPGPGTVPLGSSGTVTLG